MSSGRIRLASSALPCASLLASALISSGCAHLHPASIIPQSRFHAAAQHRDGLLVCERQSLARTSCAFMPRADVDRMFAEMIRGY